MSHRHEMVMAMPSIRSFARLASPPRMLVEVGAGGGDAQGERSMSRWAMAVIGVAFFAVALVVAVVESHLWPATAGSVVGSTLVIYAVSVVVPLIVWAVGRFQWQRAIAPVVVWGILLVVVGTSHVLATAIKALGPSLPAMLASFMQNPAVKEGFKKGFVTSATKSCVDTARSKNTPLSDTQLEAYCACTATQMVDTLTAEDMMELVRGGDELPPEVRSKIAAIVARCREETLGAGE
jgi:hypothetical protein